MSEGRSGQGTSGQGTSGEADPSSGITAPSLITALVANGRREGRYDVEMDGAAVATVGVEAVATMRLAVGRRLDERALAALLEEGAVVEACDRALNILAFRDRSAMELRRALVKKGIESGPAAAAVERLREAGLVDDARYARALARSKAVNAGASRRRIEQELGRRGVPREVADDAVAEVWVEEEVDQVAAAAALARRRAPSLARLDAVTRRRRMYGFLARRGYSGDEIRRALESVGEESDDATDDATDD